MNLTAIEIYEKEFKKSKDKGYDIEDINNYLDLIIEDYMFMEKTLIKLKELEIENQNLKIKISALKTTSKEVDKSVSTPSSNIDILKRISRLEQAVFGKNNE
ncbi:MULTISPECIES: DivIVA domain-containing protein [unclassified Gemella]|uniref:DivIVA domain-containing protein n=1 Tax=unclassified Gemella TaxID=2624949 RepID=UPI001C03A664|nr:MULTISPECIES: DivIVA domain-containing protein [unclassified Gemella]MBU0278288.1 DivIVA domain-containing protein [Gemella sp. zg-1178]QWQ38206.1 DivIVA domain-containing protein [Gemella sp. zg-570]